jgi:hypothetical protein
MSVGVLHKSEKGRYVRPSGMPWLEICKWTPVCSASNVNISYFFGSMDSRRNDAFGQTRTKYDGVEIVRI